MQILFGSLIFILPATLAFLVWRAVKSDRQVEKGKGRNPLLFSTVALSCNILLLYFWYVTDLSVMRGRSIPETTVAEYEFILLMLWISRMAVVLSLITIITALFSKRGLARKLCIWGSVAGLIWWPLVNVVDSELLGAYMRHHR